MKKYILIIINFLLVNSQMYAQLPFTSHAVPPGVTVTNARINDLVVDAANNKWLAFGNYGIGIYDGSAWTMLNMLNSGIPSDSVISIDFDGNNNVWIGTSEGAVFKSGTNYSVYNTGNSGLPSNIVTDVCAESGITWFGTMAGLASFDGSTWTTYTTSNSGIPNDSITTLEKNTNGDLWVGTRNGLSLYNGSTWTNFTTLNSSICRYISELETDNDGHVWITGGYIGGLNNIVVSSVYFIENNQVKKFETDYYFYDLSFSYANSAAIAKDSNGDIVFQAIFNNDRGIFKINNGVVEFFTLGALNYGAGIYGNQFTFDNYGLLWAIPNFRFYFYSMSFTGYIPPPFGTINFENHRSLDINGVRAGINVAGEMHWDLNNPKYEVPKGSGINSVFASALWIGGIDQGGQIHMAGQTYRQTGIDYWSGPIDGISVPFDTASCVQFDRIWKMDKWKVEEFKDQFLAGNVTNGTYVVPEEIASWPAKGNGIVVDNMAPFVDFNSNGNYNPMDGDYPLIKGDQMLFYIFNDSLGMHTETGGARFGVEVHASVYAYNCQNIADSNQVLNWTTLYHYDIINRSVSDYDSVFIGLWTDIDLGNAIDDYVGCDTTQATGFVYNGDNDDETLSGYGMNPPMQNIKILRGVRADNGDGIDNDVDGTIDEPGERTSMNTYMYYNNVNNSANGNPGGAADFYNYLTAHWLDGTPVTYGGSGYQSSNIPTNFMYSGVPYSGTGWTEGSAGNPPEDKRFIMSSGPFSLNAGDTANIDFAYVFTWDSLSPNGLATSIARNQADLQRVQYWFDNNNFPSCETYTVGLPESFHMLGNISVYPNPATDKLFVNSEVGSLYGKEYTVYNLMGKEITRGKLSANCINIFKLPPQVYLLKIDFANGTEYAKFVKR